MAVLSRGSHTERGFVWTRNEQTNTRRVRERRILLAALISTMCSEDKKRDNFPLYKESEEQSGRFVAQLPNYIANIEQWATVHIHSFAKV
jgi:hypothetical protein